ncbi:MAG TPA: hypothetical protein VLC79_09805 [Cellvibrio sp.]|nr:hypothetical protein [Cellvibrio sp.]
MNIWFFIILLIAMAMVIGPISMLRPSPAQKRKEKLRLYASEHGLRFSMRRLPKLNTDIEEPAPAPVYYLPSQSKISAVSEWMLIRTGYVHDGNFHQEWDWQGSVRPADSICSILKEYLPKLPASVSAVSEGNLGVCVFWSEKEGEETLDLLISMLNALRQAGDH